MATNAEALEQLLVEDAPRPAETELPQQEVTLQQLVDEALRRRIEGADSHELELLAGVER